MLAQSQPLDNPAPLPAGEISAADLLDQLAQHRGKRLIFRYEGRDVSIGYHVTEVKSGAFQALDCGANFESWHETFIQLWDVPPEDDRGLMPVAKFLAIIGKVAEAVPFDPKAKVTFEVSDGKRAMQLYRASSHRCGRRYRPRGTDAAAGQLQAARPLARTATVIMLRSSADAKPCCN